MAHLFEQPSLAETLGLRHVIEDGLAILAGEHVAAGRKDFVLRDLHTLLDEAIRGSHIASGMKLYLAEQDRHAFGSFTLLDYFLSSSGSFQQWQTQIPPVVSALEKLRTVGNVSSSEKEAAAKMLAAMLAQVSMEPSFHAESEASSS